MVKAEGEIYIDQFCTVITDGSAEPSRGAPVCR